ncbi:hypothetical protein C8R44DRAFT_894990 [Mycena epipterygia]|nr:hypothetical protein C8R44DRAFT_894990 [Mycena epipterygia]
MSAQKAGQPFASFFLTPTIVLTSHSRISSLAPGWSHISLFPLPLDQLACVLVDLVYYASQIPQFAAIDQHLATGGRGLGVDDHLLVEELMLAARAGCAQGTSNVHDMHMLPLALWSMDLSPESPLTPQSYRMCPSTTFSIRSS